MKIVMKLFLCSILLLVLSSGLFAQCPVPAMKTAVLMSNGINVGPKVIDGVLTSGKAVWAKEVKVIGANFFTAHPLLDQNCVKFVPVYNTSDGIWKDL